MSPKADVSEKRKSQIVDAATKVFARLGFKESRMDDIVEESGFSKGLLYWYFKSKDSIIVAVMERLFRPQVLRVKRIAESDDGAREKLLAVGRDAVREIRGMNRVLPITFEYYSYAFRNKALRRVLREVGKEYYGTIQGIIEEGIRNGEFRPIDARKAALSVGATIEGSLLLGVFAPKTVDFGEQIVATIELLADGLAAGGPPQNGED